MKEVNYWFCFFFLFGQDETSNEGLVVDVDGPVSATDFRNSHLPSSQFGDVPKVARLGHHFTFSSGSGIRMRPNVRGTSKRGRPRGSRRGGPIGGKGRGMLLLHPPSIKNSASTGHLSPSSSPSHSTTISNDLNPQYGEYISICCFSSLCISNRKKIWRGGEEEEEGDRNESRPFNACVSPQSKQDFIFSAFFRKNIYWLVLLFFFSFSSFNLQCEGTHLFLISHISV